MAIGLGDEKVTGTALVTGYRLVRVAREYHVRPGPCFLRYTGGTMEIVDRLYYGLGSSRSSSPAGVVHLFIF